MSTFKKSRPAAARSAAAPIKALDTGVGQVVAPDSTLTPTRRRRLQPLLGVAMEARATVTRPARRRPLRSSSRRTVSSTRPSRDPASIANVITPPTRAVRSTGWLRCSSTSPSRHCSQCHDTLTQDVEQGSRSSRESTDWTLDGSDPDGPASMLRDAWETMMAQALAVLVTTSHP